MNDAQFLDFIATKLFNAYPKTEWIMPDWIARLRAISEAIEENSYTESVEWNHAV